MLLIQEPRGPAGVGMISHSSRSGRGSQLRGDMRAHCLEGKKVYNSALDLVSCELWPEQESWKQQAKPQLSCPQTWP